MTRSPILLLSFLLFCGCGQLGTSVELKPVAVDEAAAYPSQEPGTRPPILTGFTPLTKEQLDEGWVQLFDGVSTFGWEVSEGEGTISVKTDGKKNALVLDKKDKEMAVLAHRFCKFHITFNDDKVVCGGNSRGWEGYFFQPFLYGVEAMRAKPNDPQPLTESDWKPAAGKSEAKWTDGMLELTGGSGMVETVKEYGDFVLQLEYFTEKGINSGIFFRCIPGELMNGYECQILNTPSDKDYKSFIGTDTGGIFRRQVGRNVGPKDGEWNYLTVAARGPHIATWVNGIQVTDWTDTREEHPNPRNGKRLEPGTIQLQGHDPATKILFRNFRIAEMDTK